MNSLFIRVFGGLLLSLVVVGFFCSLLFSSLNKVRFEDHAIEVAEPLMKWLAHLPQKDLATVLSINLPPGVQITLTEAKGLNLDALTAERLSWGQVVVQNSGKGNHVFQKYDSGLMLTGYFPDFYRDVAGTFFNVVNHQLANAPGKRLREEVAELTAVTGHEIVLIDDEDMLPDPSILEDLADYRQAVQQASDGSIRRFYIQLNSGEIARIAFKEGFNPLAWPIVMVLIVVSGSMLAGTVYLLLQALSVRLRNLETVAGRIARGELDARVKILKMDVLGRLGESFNSMADHIQRLVLVQKEMIHAVSHELRTPVARIRFGVQMIEDCPSREAMTRQLKGIDNDIQELDELIDEILTYARLEQGGPILDIQESDIVKIVSQVVSEQSSVMPDLAIGADFQGDSTNWRLSEIEPRYIHRAIQNLVGNATRYCKSTVTVKCNFDAETCRVDVEDDGPGIPESDWEKVFTPFARLDDSRTRSSGGYGLGLSIVRRILFWHGGQAILGRSEMGGAKFTLIWPRVQQAA